MVDINLFKDDDNQEDRNQNSNEGAGEDQNADLGDDFNFDDDFNETSSLDDAALLGEEDAIPDFEEPEDTVGEEDYDYGEVKKQKTSPVIWVMLGLAILVFVYFYVVDPMLKKQKQAVRPKKPVATRVVQSDENQRAGVTQTTQTPTGQTAKPGKTTPGGTIAQKGKTIPVFVNSGKAIFNDLSSQGQLGTIVLDGNHFNIGYVSSTPNVAQTVGKRIQQLLGITTFKASPEDRHRTAGKIHYWGVISGKLFDESVIVFRSTGKQFVSATQFSDELKTLAKNQGVSVSQTQTFSQRTEGSAKFLPIQMKFQGSKTQLVSFMSALNGFKGNFGLTKLTIAPVSISDFKATQAKLLLEFRVYTK